MQRTRRAFLAGAGLAATALAGCLEGSDYEDGWNRATTDTEDTLNDVVALENDAMAVGDDGTVIKRLSEGKWRKQTRNPGAENETNIYAVDTTTNNERAWFVGANGLVGVYDDHGDFDNHSRPLNMTSRFVDVAVNGAAGGEQLFLVDENGVVVRGSENKQGQVNWGTRRTPGRGVALALTFTTAGYGYVCTDEGEAFQEVGNGWNQIGVPNVSSGLTDVAGHEQSLVDVSSSQGQIHRYNGYDWSLIDLGEHPIDALVRTGRRGLAVSSDGVVYALDRHWQLSVDNLPEGLNGATTGTDESNVFCVGNNGFLIYRGK